MENSTGGMYAWGGPGTIRLLQTKYHSPRINTDSFMHLYDSERVSMAAQIFNCSDIWVTYSWGFADQTEKADREFIRSKVKKLQEVGMRVHLYVQGLNLVSNEFQENKYWCEDQYGRELPYSKGRKMICPNSLQTRKLLRQRVTDAASESADGVYVDNILFGFPPAFIRSDFAPFFGCACDACKTKFRIRYRYPLTFPLIGKQKIKDYLEFRSETTRKLVAELSAIARSRQKFFGINLYDPAQMNSEIYFGYKLSNIERYLDYLLIENHSLPSTGRLNTHLTTLIKTTGKPVFVVSYEKGIGFESEYSQSDFDSIASEAKKLEYKPCYKVSEFTTDGVWHALDFSKLQRIDHDIKMGTENRQPKLKLQLRQWYDNWTAKLLGYIGIPLVTFYFENKYVHILGQIFYKRGIHSWKNFEKDD